MVVTDGASGPASSGLQTGLASGTVMVIAAEALAFPAGLLATILLTRHLPPSEYGALALALAGTAWLEWTVVSLFSRAAWKLIAEADNWPAVATAVVRAYLLASLPIALLVFAAADATANALRIPSLAPVLRVLAFEISIFVTAHAYRTVLIGRGLHRSRAAVTAARWTVRALLIAVGTLLGASLTGIAALIVLATTVELAVVRWRAMSARRTAHLAARRDRTTGPLNMRAFVVYAAPLAISAICLRLFDRIDIFALRMLGGSMESVAAYGVAQNLALGPGLFGSAFTPALIAALSYRLARGDHDGARQLSREALRAGFLLMPLILLTAGAAPQLIVLLFGPAYAAAAPLFALLLLGAAGTLLMALAGGLLVAAGKLRWTVALTAPLLLIAGVGHLLVIPRLGAVGAATVTAGTALAGAAGACAVAWSLLGTGIPLATLLRGVLLGGVAGWVASTWHVSGFAVLPALAALAVILGAAMCLAGELRSDERARLKRWTRSLLRPATALR
jgi:O-antigen/teichoic acid export membrane protein